MHRLPVACTSRIPAASSSGSSAGSSSSARAPTRATSWVPGRISPRHQPTSRGSGATARAVTTSTVPTALATERSSARPRTTRHGRPLGTAVAELGDRLLEELHPAGHRLHQGQREIRPGQAQRDARQPGTAADVDDPGALGHGLGDRRAVEHVPLPEPRDLPRADETAGDAVGGQPGDVVLGRRAGRRRRPGRHRRGGGAAGVGRPACARPARSLVGQDHDAAVRLLALGLAVHAGDTAMTSWTTLRSNGFIGLSRSGWRLLGHPAAPSRRPGGEVGAALGPEAADVEHQPAAHAGGLRHGEAGELLERLQRGAVRTDQVVEAPPTMATEARSPSTSRSMSPSTSRMSRSRSR